MTVIEQIRKNQGGIIKDNSTYANNTRIYANHVFSKTNTSILSKWRINIGNIIDKAKHCTVKNWLLQ